MFFVENGKIKQRLIVDQNQSIDINNKAKSGSDVDILRLVGEWNDLVISLSPSRRTKNSYFLSLDELELSSPLGCKDPHSTIRVSYTMDTTRAISIRNILNFSSTEELFANLLGMEKPYVFVDRLQSGGCEKDSCGVRIGVINDDSAFGVSIPGLYGAVNSSRLDPNLFSELSDPCISNRLLFLPWRMSSIVDKNGRYFTFGDFASKDPIWKNISLSYRHLIVNPKFRQWFSGTLTVVSEASCKSVLQACSDSFCEYCLNSVLEIKTGGYIPPSKYMVLRWDISDSLKKAKPRHKRRRS